jgi:hypothetical protein
MAFQPVTSIDNFSPVQMIVKTEYELSATVSPNNATNQEIDWSVTPGTAATFRTGANGKKYITPQIEGDFTVTAVIKNGLVE